MNELRFLVRGRCPNVDYCELAASRLPIELDSEARFVCPECARKLKPLSPVVQRGPALGAGHIGIALMLGLIAAGLYAGFKLGSG